MTPLWSTAGRGRSSSPSCPRRSAAAPDILRRPCLGRPSFHVCVGISEDRSSEILTQTWIGSRRGARAFGVGGVQSRRRSVTTPLLARTRSVGDNENTSFHVPAAAQTTSYCNRSG